MRYKVENFKDLSLPIYSTRQKREGNIVKVHYHPACELLLVCEGRIFVSVDTAEMVVEEGGLLFIPPLAVHSIFAKEVCKIKTITFEPELLDAKAMGLDFGSFFARGRISDFVTAPQQEAYEGLRAAFDDLYVTYREDIPSRRIALLSKVYGVAAALRERYDMPLESENVYHRLRPALDYMEAHFTEPLSLEKIADALNVCPDHAIRMFKKITNKTPIRYLRDLRLTEGMKLLAETDYSVEEIAVRCGFNDANYFGKAFKDMVNRTPLAYRKIHRKK